MGQCNWEMKTNWWGEGWYLKGLLTNLAQKNSFTDIPTMSKLWKQNGFQKVEMFQGVGGGHFGGFRGHQFNESQGLRETPKKS